MRSPSQTHNSDSSGPVSPSSITTRVPAAPNDAPESFADVLDRFCERLGDEDPLARSQAIRLHHVEAR